MNALVQASGFVLICLAALAGGVALRMQHHSPTDPVAGADGTRAVKVEADDRANSPWGTTPAQETVMRRRAIAKCDDESLWVWLHEPTDDGGTLLVSIEELVDRRGWGAWEDLLAREPHEYRGVVVSFLFAELAERDPWRAYGEWQKHRGDFPSPAWADDGFRSILNAAALVSADRVCDILFETGREDDGRMAMEVDYPPGFDFQPVAEYLVLESKDHFIDPQDVLRAWGDQQPYEAAAWYATRPNCNLVMSRERKDELYLAVAGSDLPPDQMREALTALGGVSPELENEGWKHIGAESKGRVNAALLDSAGLVGRRDEYLRRVLAQTRFHEELDTAWLGLPLDDRLRAKAAVMKEWKAERPGETNDQARARWEMKVPW